MRKKYNRERQLSDNKKDLIIAEEAKFNQEWAKLKKKLIIEITDSVSGANNSLEGKAESEEEMLIKEQE